MCKKPMTVWRYSDVVVLICQLSKSCSCGIKTDTVPVSDLGGGRGGENGKKSHEENNHSHQGLYRFHLPRPWSGLRVASGGEMVSGDIISLLFTQESRELEERLSVTSHFLLHLLQLIRGSWYQGGISSDLGFVWLVNLLRWWQVFHLWQHLISAATEAITG